MNASGEMLDENRDHWSLRTPSSEIKKQRSGQVKLTGAKIVAELLKREGLEFLFGYPNSELFDACAEIDVRPVIARTPRVAVNLAEGYARVMSGRAMAAVTVQYGPGAESAFGAIAQAFNDRAAVLFLPTGYPRGSTASAPNFESSRNFRHITKWCETVTRIEDLQALLRQAISRLRNGPPAPVLLELPVDVLAESYTLDLDEWQPVRRARPQADASEVEEIVTSLLHAKHPVILAGSGVLDAQASAELTMLAELLQIPVMTTPNGKSAFDERHPLALGTAGRARPTTVDEFAGKADVILALGTSLTRSYYIFPLPQGRKILQVTIDEADIGKDYPVALGVIGDVRSVLRQLLCRLKDSGTLAYRSHDAGEGSSVATEIATIRRRFSTGWQAELNADSVPLSPYRVIAAIADALNPDDCIVTHDAGNPRDQITPFYLAGPPGSYIGWGKTTQLGSSLGYVLGARLARQYKIAVAFMGEAAFGAVAMDFETAVRCDLPILVVVLRNNVLGGYAASMPIATRKYAANAVSGSYAPIACALGGYGEHVDSPDELAAALERCLDEVREGRPALLEVLTHEESRLAGLS